MKNAVNQRDALLAQFDNLSRLEKWQEAEKALRECMGLGLIYGADFNLSLATLAWRKAAADEARSLLQDGPMEIEAFRRELSSRFEPFVVDWMLWECSALHLEQAGGRFFVEVE